MAEHMTDSLYVFISHAKVDIERVRPLAQRLSEEGLNVFLDEWEIFPGDSVSAELEQAISRSNVGIVVFSTASVTRPWVNEEYYAILLRAVKGRARLIPVVLDEVELPVFAGNRRAVYFGDEGSPAWEAEFAALVRGVRKQAS